MPHHINLSSHFITSKSASTCEPYNSSSSSSNCSSSSNINNDKCCKQLAKIIGFKKAETKIQNGVCVIEGQRCIKPEITEKCNKKGCEKIRSPLTKAVDITFECNDGKFLNFIEIALFQEEVNPLIKEFVKRKIQISALHNHEILVKPLRVYLHASSNDQPQIFAKKLHDAFKSAINPCTKKSILETLQ